MKYFEKESFLIVPKSYKIEKIEDDEIINNRIVLTVKKCQTEHQKCYTNTESIATFFGVTKCVQNKNKLYI